MSERDVIFREKLVALMTAINGGEGKEPGLRRLVGAYAHRLAKDAGSKSWADLKRRADAPTYNALLALLQSQGAEHAKRNDLKGVRALEALGLSLVARHQAQADLVPGVGFLDRFIEECESVYRRAGKVVVATRPRPH